MSATGNNDHDIGADEVVVIGYFSSLGKSADTAC
jgi:hypothetical protein